MPTSRYDKYDPYDGGFRARLNAAIAAADVGKIFAVTINGSGRAVIGAATIAEYRGVICPTEAMPAGAQIDVMTDGEIAQAELTATGVRFAAGSLVYAAATTGHINNTNTGKPVGFCVEEGRLVVRLNPL